MLARLLAPALLPLALGTINTGLSSSWTQYRNEATPAIAATWDSVEWIPVPERDQLVAYGTTGAPGHEALYHCVRFNTSS